MRRTLPRVVFFALPVTGFLTIMSMTNDAKAEADVEEDARAFIRGHEETIRPREREAALAWWNANVTGKDEDFKAKEEAQNQLDKVLSDKGRFAELKALEDAKIGDPLLARQIHVLYLGYLEKQVDPELLKKMTAKSNAVEKAFNVYRANVDGKEMTDSEVRKVLKESKLSDRRKAVWESNKCVGAKVEADLKELVQLRNQAAKQLGFKDYHVMQLHLN